MPPFSSTSNDATAVQRTAWRTCRRAPVMRLGDNTPPAGGRTRRRLPPASNRSRRRTVLMPRPHAAAPLPLPPSSGRRWPQLLLVAAAVAGTVLLLEVACRLLGVDFEFKARAFERVPIFYRQPVVPVGDGFFRRPGPATWTGRVLDAGMRAVQRHEGIYAADPVVTIAYDRDGFRNPEDLADWGVAVAGDSFTELGHLPYEELFTTGLARRLGTGVRNLGVSYTGPFTQTFYLRAYGRAPSTSDAVLVFFEGND